MNEEEKESVLEIFATIEEGLEEFGISQDEFVEAFEAFQRVHNLGNKDVVKNMLYFITYWASVHIPSNKNYRS